MEGKTLKSLITVKSLTTGNWYTNENYITIVINNNNINGHASERGYF